MKNEGYEKTIADRRAFMKSNYTTAQMIADKVRGLPQPPISKAPMCAESIALPKDFENSLQQRDYWQLLQQRRSGRVFAEEPLSLPALSFLLWSTQGVQSVAGGVFLGGAAIPR